MRRWGVCKTHTSRTLDGGRWARAEDPRRTTSTLRSMALILFPRLPRPHSVRCGPGNHILGHFVAYPTTSANTTELKRYWHAQTHGRSGGTSDVAHWVTGEPLCSKFTTTHPLSISAGYMGQSCYEYLIRTTSASHSLALAWTTRISVKAAWRVQDDVLEGL